MVQRESGEQMSIISSPIRWLRSLVHLRVVLTLGACASLLLVQLTTFADDPGLGWHLALGRWIQAHHALPTVDPFLHYVEKAPQWICDQWLSDIFLYTLYDLGSWTLLYAVLLVVYLLSFFWGMSSFLLRLQFSFASTMLATVLSFKLAQVHFIARPVVFNVPLLLASYALSYEVLRSRATRLHYALLAVLIAVWANIHGSFVVGLAIVLWALGLKGLEALREREYSVCARNVILGAVFCCSSLLNPYGVRLYKNILTHVGSEYFVNLLEEWRPLVLGGFEGRVFLFSVLVIIVAFVFNLSRLSLLKVFEYSVVFGFAWYAYKHTRMLPVFAVVAAVPLARSFDQLWAFLRVRLESLTQLPALIGRFDSFQARSAPSAGFYLPFTAVFFLSCYFVQGLPLVEIPLGPSNKKYPYGAVRYLQESGLKQFPGVIAAHPNWGGFITFYGEGKLKAIVDDRNRMRGEEFYKTFFTAFEQTDSLPQFLRQEGSDYLLLKQSSSISLHDTDGKALPVCYQDEVARLIALESICPERKNEA